MAVGHLSQLFSGTDFFLPHCKFGKAPVMQSFLFFFLLETETSVLFVIGF